VKSFKEYWKEKGSLISARRKARYRNDSDYRAKIREYQKAAYRKRRGDKPVRGVARILGDRVTVNKVVYITVPVGKDFRRVRAYSTSQVAKRLNITRPWLLKLEAQGVIPPPANYKDANRLYTEDELQAILETAREVAKMNEWVFNWKYSCFPERLKDKWGKLINGVKP
jgi:hypothetical protein